MTAIAKGHQHFGYLLVVLVAIEFFRVLITRNNEDEGFGKIFSKSITGLVHLQVTVGVIYFYLLWPNGPHLLHPIGTVTGAILLHVSSKYEGNKRVGTNLGATVLIIGAVFVAIMTEIQPIL